MVLQLCVYTYAYPPTPPKSNSMRVYHDASQLGNIQYHRMIDRAHVHGATVVLYTTDDILRAHIDRISKLYGMMDQCVIQGPNNHVRIVNCNKYAHPGTLKVGLSETTTVTK